MLEGSIGFRRKIYPTSGEKVLVLAGRSYSETGNSNPLAGNTMSKYLETGEQYVVPASRRFLALSYRLTYSLVSATQGIAGIYNFLNSGSIVPIGQGTSDITTNYGIVAHLDFRPQFSNYIYRNNQGQEADAVAVYAEEEGDMEVGFNAGQYPKIGTVGRTARGIAPGQVGIALADVMIWGIEMMA